MQMIEETSNETNKSPEEIKNKLIDEVKHNVEDTNEESKSNPITENQCSNEVLYPVTTNEINLKEELSSVEENIEAEQSSVPEYEQPINRRQTMYEMAEEKECLIMEEMTKRESVSRNIRLSEISMNNLSDSGIIGDISKLNDYSEDIIKQNNALEISIESDTKIHTIRTMKELYTDSLTVGNLYREFL